MMSDKVREIIDLQDEDLPKGQRLLRMGYKPITDAEMNEMLETDRLADEFNDGLVKDLKFKYKIVKEEEFWISCSNSKWYIFSWDFVARKKEGGIKKTHLEGYHNKMIPPRCLQEVSKARQSGFSQFWVVEPTLISPDPLIVGSYEESEDYWFITRWE